MAGVIAYDKPVVDFIAALNATGHVTNVAYRKASVTFHHNGGRLSLQGCLDVWKVRPASAHFQVDGGGRLGQYVKANEYAWAAGNTQGNKESIHIEMANATLAPTWTVAEVTWREAARLCGWIHARILGVRPSRTTVKVHHDWKATLCAGPHIDTILGTLIAESQKAYDAFVGGGAPRPSPTPTPAPGKKPIATIVSEVIAGHWGNGPDRVNRLRSAGYDPAAVQAEVNRRLSGGKPAPTPAPKPTKKTVQQLAEEVMRGDWGNNPERSRRLQAAGYSPSAVQAEVNSRFGAGAGRVVRLSVAALADQVIKGQWGNGPERQRRITSAGYDYRAVQAEVNRRLR